MSTNIARKGEVVPLRGLQISPDEPISDEQRRRLRGPIVAGGITCAVFVVGFLVWAAVFKIAGGVTSPGVVVVENNRKTVEHLDGGVIRKILVHEGDEVKRGQVLFELDDTQARAQVDVLSNQYDSLLAQRARLEAILAGRSKIEFPPELTSRAGDPRVAGMMRDQENLFDASQAVYVSQSGVLNQRMQQLRSRGQGLSAQVTSVDQQTKLVEDELSGVKSLYERGFAPKSRLLALERSRAGLVGDRGARQADIASVGQAIGETRIQLAQLREQRATETADQLRQVQVQIADILPRLRAAEAVLTRTIVRAPTDGAVLGMTQFTEGGVARPGEKLLDVVPEGAPLVVRATVRPDHIDEVKIGMPAEIHLSAYSSRKVPPVKARVIKVSADRITNEKGDSFFTAELAVDPKELKQLGPEVKLSPGMPAQTIIVTGERTILDYLVSPFEDTIKGALREN
jgi:HlyD family secretion protein/epimerase transport system membrane fusion protein